MIVILGGGITGLAAAYQLTRRGVPCVVLEKSSRAGGLIRTEHVGGFTLDAGPDSLLAQKPAALELCRELGIANRLTSMKRPRTAYVLRGGRLFALPAPSVLGIPTGAAGIARYGLLGLRARARLALEPLVAPGTAEDESVASFFRRRFGEDTVGLIADPLLGGIHAGDVEQLSMRSVFPRLVEAEQKPGRVLRNASSPASDATGDGMFRALRGGMAELVDGLLRAVPAGTVQCDRGALRLEPCGRRWRVHTASGVIEADGVIVATPAHVAAGLVRPLDSAAADLCDAVPYASTVSVALGWRRSDVRHPLLGSGFVVARRHNAMRLTACTWVSSKWEDRAPAGHVLLRAFAGSVHDAPAVEASDEELVDLAVRELTPILGISAPPVLSRVFRAPRAGAQHTVGHRQRVASLLERLSRFHGLFVAGSGFESIGIPDCVRNGRSVADLAADYVTIAR